MQITIDPKRVEVIVPYDVTLSFLASGIEYSICWFMGSGIWRWRILKTNIKEGVRLEFQALVEPKSVCAFAGAATIEGLAKENYIPYEIDPEEIWTKEGQRKFSLTEGIAKTQKFNPNKGEFVCQTEELFSKTTLSQYAWGICDTLVDLLLRKATEIKHQASIRLAQTWANINISDEELKTWADQDYDPNRKVIVLK